MKKFIVIFLLYLSNPLFSQEKEGFLYFEEDVAYLGHLQKEAKPIKHQFEFTVVGSSVQIDKVKSDCACLVANYPKNEMEVGKKGKIEIEFSPYRPGPFEKIFKIKLKGISEEIELTLSGYIEIFYPDPELEFPHLIGGVRVKNKKISLGTISDEGVVSRKVEMYNKASYPIIFLDSVVAPKHVEFIFDSLRTIPPMSRKTFELFYNPQLKGEFGYVVDNITLFTEDEAIPLAIDASIKEYFPSFGDIDFDTAPQLAISSDSMDLGIVYLENDRVIEFELMNQGASNLLIHKVVPNYGSESLMITPKIVKPNDTKGLRVRVKDIGKSGRQQRSLMLFTNDPTQPTKELVIFMNVRR